MTTYERVVELNQANLRKLSDDELGNLLVPKEGEYHVSLEFQRLVRNILRKRDGVEEI